MLDIASSIIMEIGMKDFLANKIILEDMADIESRCHDWSWLNNKAILITGAYGMLAAYCVFFLIYLNEKYGRNIRILCQGRNKEKLKHRFGKYVEKKYFQYLSFDICSDISLEGGVDYIIHAASLASPQFYATNPVDVILPNVLGTYNLLNLAKIKKTIRVLFFSSSDIYGQLPDSDMLFTENDYGYIDVMNFRSCYAESKRVGETLCVSYNKQYNVPIAIVRISHTYGPTLDLRNDKRVFSEFVRNIIDKKNIEMKSDGLARRCFCYISDATDAFFRILHNDDVAEAYNMCNPLCEISIKELGAMLVELYADRNLELIISNREETEQYVESPVKKVPKFSIEKLQKLGWNPRVSLSNGFKRTIASFEDEGL